MITRIITVNAEFPEKEKIAEAVDIIRAGGIACLPTETVFGLACNGDDNEAVKKMYEIKKRPENKKFVIQVADISQIIAYRPHIELEIKIILGKFWPGPLTVILNTKYGKTGFRMPDNKTTLAVIREADFPLMVTSANISGEKSLLSAKDAISVFNGLIEVVVNDKTKAKGIASTVLDCSEKPFKILRKGPLGQALKRHQKDILWSA